MTIPHIRLTTTATNDDGSVEVVERETSYFYDDQEEEECEDEGAEIAESSSDVALDNGSDVDEGEEENGIDDRDEN